MFGLHLVLPGIRRNGTRQGLVVGARGQAATDLEKKVQEQIANNKVQICGCQFLTLACVHASSV
jgi:hypothetical protein